MKSTEMKEDSMKEDARRAEVALSSSKRCAIVWQNAAAKTAKEMIALAEVTSRESLEWKIMKEKLRNAKLLSRKPK